MTDQVIAELTAGDHLPVEGAPVAAIRAKLQRAIPAGSLTLTKHKIGAVSECEAKFVAETAVEFAWKPAFAKGTIVHKALQIWVVRDANANELVSEAIRLVSDYESGLADWLNSCPPADRAELTSAAVAVVSSVQDTWPRLDKNWRPVSETKIRASVRDTDLVGQVDLTLGRPGKKVLIDWKTGKAHARHREDLMFYALIETLRIGVSPRSVASAYVDAGGLDVLPVTPERLGQAADRVIGAASALRSLAAGREPVRSRCLACRWCPLEPDCDEAASSEDDWDDWREL